MPAVIPLVAAGVGAAATVASTRNASRANDRAIAAQQQGADASIAEQRRQFDIAQQNQQPWLNVGRSALSELATIYGLSQGMGANRSTYDFLRANPDTRSIIDAGHFGGPSDLNAAANFVQNEYGYAQNPSATSTGNQGSGQGATGQGGGSANNFAAFFASPDYQFRQNEQMRALTARNAALGIQDSGAAQRAAIQYSGNLASGEFNNYANRLASLAGVGQTAASQSAQLGQNFANNFSNITQNNANNLASSYQNRAQLQNQGYGNLAGIGVGLLQNFSRPSYYGGPPSDLRGLY